MTQLDADLASLAPYLQPWVPAGSTLTPDTSFAELGIDSLTLVELLLDMAVDAGIEPTALEDLATVGTIGELAALVQRFDPAVLPDPATVWARAEVEVPSAPIAAFDALADDLEHAVFESSDGYSRSYGVERLRWAKSAAAGHLEASPAFARVARHSGFDVDAPDLDLDSIPLLSCGLFKHMRVASHMATPPTECSSSGTRGTRSLVLRDDQTLTRFAGSLLHGMREFWEVDDTRVAFALTPQGATSGESWLAYAFSHAELLYETEYFVADGVLQSARLFRALRDLDRRTAPLLLAPPSLLADFLAWLEAAGLDLRLPPGAMIITGGGWKARGDRVVARDALEARVEQLLGVPPVYQRDLYNMVELNSVVFDCERHGKHLPPWLIAFTRDLASFEVLPAGGVGVLCYVDPTATSYPCFLLSDDVGAVVPGPCECGRHGPLLQFQRRLRSIEERGCGKVLSRYGPE